MRAVVATFFTLLGHTVIMVIVFIGVLRFQRKRYCLRCVVRTSESHAWSALSSSSFRGYSVKGQKP